MLWWPWDSGMLCYCGWVGGPWAGWGVFIALFYSSRELQGSLTVISPFCRTGEVSARASEKSAAKTRCELGSFWPRKRIAPDPIKYSSLIKSLVRPPISPHLRWDLGQSVPYVQQREKILVCPGEALALQKEDDLV